MSAVANKIGKKRQLSCRDIGGSCDFVAQAETEEEVMELGLHHGCFIHNLCNFSPEIESWMKCFF